MTRHIEQTLVDSIYDGITEQPPWTTFLHLFRRQLKGVAAGLWLRSPMLEEIRFSLSDFEPEYEGAIASYKDTYHRSAVLFRAEIAHGEVQLISEITNLEDLSRTEHYQQFLAPNNIGDGLQFHIEEPQGLRLWIEAGRSLEAPLFGEEEKQFCSVLVPHLGRALGIYSSMMRFKSEADIYSHLVEQLTVGVIILDRDAQIIRVNSYAGEMIHELGCMDVCSDKFRFSQEVDQRAFLKSFQKALSLYDNGSHSSTVELLRIETSAAGPIGVLVRCLAPNLWYEGKGCPVVVLYLCDSTSHKSAREYFVAKLFGLTISESALAIMLADGKTLAEAAVALNVTENTTRTVSKRIFSKTGVRRQAELVRLILNSIALLS